MSEHSTPNSSATDLFDTREQEANYSVFNELDLLHYLRILRKFKWPITLFTALVTALAIFYVYTATPIYRATSTLLIEDQGGDPIPIGELVGIDTQSQDYYQTQYELLRSRGLALRVINNLNLWEHPEFSDSAREKILKAEGVETALSLIHI